MSVETNNLTIIRMPISDDNDSLHKSRNEELLKIHKLELILSLVKKAPVEKFQIMEKENLQRAIKIVAIQNYLKLTDNLTLLGLNNCHKVDLLYTERKAIRNYLIEEIPNVILPLINYIKDLQIECPDIFKSDQKQNEILALEDKRQKLTKQFVEIKNKKCGLLKICAELKMGPYLKNEIKLLHSNYKLNQVKANALQGFLLDEICSRTDHTVKAIKEVTKYINDELEE